MSELITIPLVGETDTGSAEVQPARDSQLKATNCRRDGSYTPAIPFYKLQGLFRALLCLKKPSCRRQDSLLTKKWICPIYAEPIQYLNGIFRQDDNDYFDKSVAESFIFQRVLDLGWDPKLHAEFDENRSDMGRQENKGERIGKKYQWIAYHELLARLCDNFEYKEDTWSDVNTYNGPWQDFIRDIDPSFVLPKTELEYWASTHSKTWWFPISYNSWDINSCNITWLQRTDDLLDIDTLVHVIKKDGSVWLNLESFYNLMEPIPPEEDKYEMKRKEIWYMVKSYIVRKAERDKLYAWLKDKNFFGRWMPESNSNIRIFLGEFYWSPAFKFHDIDYYHHNHWTDGWRAKQKLPVKVLVPTDQYLQERSGYDCSINETINLYLPSKEIVEGMSLSWNGREGEWYNDEGKLIAFDPSVRSKGPGCLLINKDAFISFLEKKEYVILWTILGEKRMIGGGYAPKEFEGRLIINGIARLEQNKIISSSHYEFEK